VLDQANQRPGMVWVLLLALSGGGYNLFGKVKFTNKNLRITGSGRVEV
jgi:hypothetical protein